MKKSLQKSLATLLVIAIMVSIMPVAFADDITEQELIADVGQYPTGAFEFLNAQLSYNEGDGTAVLDIVRRGGNAEAATVEFKAVDLSAKYGEDYTLSIREGWFTSRTLSPGAESLLDIAQDLGGITIDTDSEAESDENEEADAYETEDVIAEVEEDAEINEMQLFSSVYAEELSDDIIGEDAATNVKRSALRMARQAALGKESDRQSWQDLNPKQESALIDGLDAALTADEITGRAASELPGTRYTLSFAPGEYKKTFTINLIDDVISETDEQVMFLLYDATVAELGASVSAYLNIIDNDENEQVFFSMAKPNIYVSRDDAYAKVTVSRISGVEKFASAVIKTGAINAVQDVDYKVSAIEAVFPQGVTSQTVKIPILPGTGDGKPVSFAVVIDKSNAYVAEGEEKTIVTILPDKSEQTIADYKASLNQSSEIQAAAEETPVELMAVSGFETLSSSVQSTTTSGANASKTITYTGVDLFGADIVRVNLAATGWSTHTWSTGSGCDKKDHAENRWDKAINIKINNKDFYNWSANTDLSQNIDMNISGQDDNIRKANSTVTITISNRGDHKGSSTLKVNSIAAQFRQITFHALNGNVEGVNQYTEKIYSPDGDKTINGKRYKTGAVLKLGDAKIKTSVSTTANESAVLWRGSHTITHSVVTNANAKNNMGVNVTYGASGNTYIAGYQLWQPGTNMNDAGAWSAAIKPSAFTYVNLYANYKKYYWTATNSFEYRVVLKPYPAIIKFETDSAKGAYVGFAKDEVYRATQLDTFVVNVAATTGNAVNAYDLKQYRDTKVYNPGTSDLIMQYGDELYSVNAGTRYDKDKANVKTDVKVKEHSAALGELIKFVPGGEVVRISPVFTKPQIMVRVHPGLANNVKDKGSVYYIDSSNAANSRNGDKDNPMIISPVTMNSLYTIGALPVNGWRAYWNDFTGDADYSGGLSTEEAAVIKTYLDKGKINSTKSSGNLLSYILQVPNSLIYYGFEQLPSNMAESTVNGVVQVKSRPVFSTKETTEPVNGASVSAAGQNITTENHSRYGGKNGKGGAGYFDLRSSEFSPGDSTNVAISYKGLSGNRSQTVNYAAFHTLDAYDTFSISNARMFNKVGNNEKQIQPHEITNGDYTYVIELMVNSSSSALAPVTARFRLKDRQGETFGAPIDIRPLDYSATNNGNGIFRYSFNPANEGIGPGYGMSVQFIDQNGTAYYEHDMGFKFVQSLATLELAAAFGVPGLSTALDLIGKVSADYKFGWGGNLDSGDNITNTETEKILNYGYAFNYGTESDPKSVNLKKAADKDEPGTNNTTDARNEKKQAAENATTDAKGKNTAEKQETEVSSSVYVDFSFAIGMRLGKSEKEGHAGEWYFKDITLTVKAGAGVEVGVTFITPIGIPITITLKSGVHGTAIIVLERSNNTAEYYVGNAMTLGDGGQIPIMDIDNYDPNSAMYIYGDFLIDPYVDISATVDLTVLKVTLGGRADFHFTFSTKPNVESTGSVDLKAYLSIKVLFITKSWDLVSGTVELFSDSAAQNAILYDRLDSFDTVSRDYLNNRGTWNGGGGVSLFAAGPQSDVLQSGAYPDSDIQMADIGGGNVLAIFIDDDINRALAVNAPALFYSIWNGTSWSAPQLIEDDNTADNAPVMFDLGDSVYVAWSTANTEFDDDADVLDVLSSYDIHGAFFTKADSSFGDIQEITKTTDEGDYSDFAGDTEPQIIYDFETNQMMIQYTKSEYEATGWAPDETTSLVGDAVHPYTVIAYRWYDFANDEWLGGDSYTADDKDAAEAAYGWTAAELDSEWASYKDGFYGQRFLNLAPAVTITETLDVNGFRVGSVSVDDYAGQNDPLVVESRAISYNKLGLHAYVLDYDGDKKTSSDRDVFLQIYDFEEEYFTHPIMITASPGIEESNLRFIRTRESTQLSWLSAGSAYMWDISYNVGDTADDTVLKQGINGAQEYYWIDRSESAGYAPPVLVAQGNAPVSVEWLDGDVGDDTSSNTDDVTDSDGDGIPDDIDIYPNDADNDGIPDSEEAIITSFDLASNSRYVYGLFTQRKFILKDGVEDNSPEAALSSNKNAETQIYAVRFDMETGHRTEPVQVTSDVGANYSNIGFTVTDDGGLFIMANKQMSALKNTDAVGPNGTITSVEPDEGTSSIVSFSYTPEAALIFKGASATDIASGANADVTITTYNDGLDTLDGAAVTVTDDSGKVVHTYDVVISDFGGTIENGILVGAEEIGLLGGATHTETFTLPLAEDVKDIKLTITAKLGQETLFSEEFEKTAEISLDVMRFNASLTERNELTVDAEVINNSAVYTDASAFSITYTDSGEAKAELYSADIPALAPGESFIIADIITVDYSELFNVETDSDGNVGASTILTASAGSGYEMDETVSLNATVDQMARVKSIKDVIISVANINVGEETAVSAFVDTDVDLFNNESSQYTDTESTSTGLQVKWISSNPQVAEIADNSYIIGKSAGTADIIAVVMPADSEITEEGTVDIYPILPDEALTKYQKTVTITNPSYDRPSVGGKGGSGGVSTNKVASLLESPQNNIVEFIDVKSDTWYYDAIMNMVEKKILIGTGKNLFEPDEQLTRAMFAVILHRVAGTPAAADEANVFADVNAGDYFEEASKWAYVNGIVVGVREGILEPHTPISREQLCVMLDRYMKLVNAELPQNQTEMFADESDISDYALESVKRIQSAGIMIGDESGKFNPQSFASRAEIATVLNRLTAFIEF